MTRNPQSQPPPLRLLRRRQNNLLQKDLPTAGRPVGCHWGTGAWSVSPCATTGEVLSLPPSLSLSLSLQRWIRRLYYWLHRFRRCWLRRQIPAGFSICGFSISVSSRALHFDLWICVCV
ncbi:hypothetical protein RHGRI_013994 [Rhododendron griersonianum]|uniref:Uncharacterized protein n=1 Tax=Rhododendron griersonianum TaxID=479676 RepID=A0AAV6K819_9ERIC|nr:hypothetical protein RHGRI_013994 [Rhododendron griersonianum]